MAERAQFWKTPLGPMMLLRVDRRLASPASVMPSSSSVGSDGSIHKREHLSPSALLDRTLPVVC
jgi:hypothetical protein